MELRDKIVFASLLHDIGKLFERAEVLDDYNKDEFKQQEYCPKAKKGYYSHKHVLYTLKFCEELAEKIPVLKEQYQTDKTWINLSARHHITQDSNVLEQIIKKADHLSSGEREGETIYIKEIHKKTFLEPLLEKISLKDSAVKQTSYRYPLAPLKASREYLFPKKLTELPKLDSQSKIPISSEKLTKEYQVLGKEVKNSLENLPEVLDDDFDSLRNLCQTLLFILEKNLTAVPSATNIKQPDISLFDHLKITAGIAEALYISHDRNKTLTLESLKSEKDKWSLVCGDFSGIQSFIYSVVSKHAAKSLSGRSVFIQLFCDAVSEWLLRELKLYPTSRIYSSGGKFYLLIASSLQKELKEKVNTINQFLFDSYEGKLFLKLGIVDLNINDFGSSAMSRKFRDVAEETNKQNLQKFDFLIKKQPQKLFSALPVKNKICSVCGADFNSQESAQDQEEKNKICNTCKKFENIGKDFRDLQQTEEKKIGLLWFWNEKEHDEVKNEKELKLENGFDIFKENKKNQSKENKKGINSLFCKFYLIDKEILNAVADYKLKHCHFEYVNNIDGPLLKTKGLSIGYRFIALPDELNLDDLAGKSEGIKRIGILRMDVDNLGQIFTRGLNYIKDSSKKTKSSQEDNINNEEQKSLGSLSRFASLSRQLNLFFTAYLIQLDKGDCKIIYSGGDDLFILGPWNQLPDLANKIQKEFKSYCADNPDLNLSGGIALIKEKYPILYGAELAGKAEEQAKNYERTTNINETLIKDTKVQVKKNAFCFLGTVIGWEDFDDMKKVKQKLENIIYEKDSFTQNKKTEVSPSTETTDTVKAENSMKETNQKGWIKNEKTAKNKALLNILYHIEREANKKESQKSYQAWRHRFIYYIARLMERNNKNNEIKKEILDLKNQILEDKNSNEAQNTNYKKAVLEYLFMPVCWLDYLSRDKKPN